MKVIVNISRLLVGILFIFSGLIKANDPVGFAIKLEEYYEIFASEGGLLRIFEWHIILESVVFQAALICVVEVALGVLLLLGMWKKSVTWLLFLMIAFFTILTGYSAVTGKVTDCGCFGDAIPLTPWQSFYKDIVLLVLILILFTYKKHIQRFLPAVPSFVLAFAATAFSVWVANTAIKYDVFIDFRPYKAGNNISALMAIPEDAEPPVVEMQYIYTNKNTQEEEVVKIRSNQNDFDKLVPFSDTIVWKFKERNDRIIDPGFVPEISDFAVIDEYDNDITDKVLSYSDYMIMVVSPGLDKTHKPAWEAVNSLQRSAEEAGIFTFGLVASGRTEIDKFRHNHQTAFSFYMGDQKVCLAIARTNPAVVLLKQGTVIAKWPWREIPDFNSMKELYFPDRENTAVLFNPSAAEGTMFNPGEDISYQLANSIEPYNEFFMMDEQGDDKAASFIAESDTVFLVIINKLSGLTNSEYSMMDPLLQTLRKNGSYYAVLSSSSSGVVAEMSAVTGLGFQHFETDGEVLEKIVESNTGIIVLVGGRVAAKVEGADWSDLDIYFNPAVD